MHAQFTRILFDYLPGVGGEETAKAMRRSSAFLRSFVINTTSDVREFAEMSPETRRSKRLIYGLKAGNVAKIVEPGTTRITLICDPAERIVRAYEHYRDDPTEFLHPICKFHPIDRVVEMVPEFRDLYAQQFDPQLYDIIATDPSSLLAALGIADPSPAVAAHRKSSLTAPLAAMQRNDRDFALWQFATSQADDHGIWRHGVLPIRDQKPASVTKPHEKPQQ